MKAARSNRLPRRDLVSSDVALDSCQCVVATGTRQRVFINMGEFVGGELPERE
jgi:hypothetical protein